MNYRFKLYTLVLFTLLANLGHAQDLGLDTTQILEPVVVTAQYTSQPQSRSIYKIDVINSKKIHQSGATNLQELLQHELNLNLEQNSVFGSSLSSQGVSKENVKVLIDGIAVIGRLNGIIDLRQIDLSNISQIEIIKGPVSLFYGSDAIGGVLNLITKKSLQPGVNAKLNAYVESTNAIQTSVDLGYAKGKNTYKVNAGLYHFGGLSTNDAERNLNWEQRLRKHGEWMYNRSMGQWNLQYQGNISHEKLTSLGDINSQGKITDTEYFTRRINNAIHLIGKHRKGQHSDLSIAYQDYQRYHDNYNVDPETFEATLSTKDAKEENIAKYNHLGLRYLFGTNDISKPLNYSFGLNTFRETSNGNRILENEKSFSTVALLSSINFQIKSKLELQPGVRLTWNDTYGTFISPALNVKYVANENNSFNISYARGYRAPSLKELYLNFSVSAGPSTFVIKGNEDLKVEKAHSINLQYTFKKPVGLNNTLKIEPLVFYHHIEDLITLSEIQDFARHYININKHESVGGSLNLNYERGSNWSLSTGFSMIGRYNEFTEDFNSDNFLFTPEFTAGINYLWSKPRITFDLVYKYSGEKEGFFIDEAGENLIKTAREDFSNMNFSVSRNFIQNKLRIVLGVKNLFDVQDIQTINETGQAHARNMQLWGRSFFLKTNFTIN